MALLCNIIQIHVFHVHYMIHFHMFVQPQNSETVYSGAGLLRSLRLVVFLAELKLILVMHTLRHTLKRNSALWQDPTSRNTRIYFDYKTSIVWYKDR